MKPFTFGEPIEDGNPDERLDGADGVIAAGPRMDESGCVYREEDVWDTQRNTTRAISHMASCRSPFVGP